MPVLASAKYQGSLFAYLIKFQSLSAHISL